MRDVPARFGTVTADYRGLLADSGIGLIDVCLPAGEQPAVVEAALAAGKDVFVSGPPADSAAETSAMIAAAEAAGKRLFCLLYQRFIPAHVRLEAVLAEQALGEPSFGSVTTSLPATGEP